MFNETMRSSFLPIAFLILFAPALPAQTSTSGDIVGTVTDPSGGTMPAATILLKNNGTGAVQQKTSSSQGTYRFSFLPPASYTITVKSTNFMTVEKVVPVQVGQVTTVDVQLSIKSASTSVEVLDFAVGVQTDNGNLSTTVTPQQLAELPNSGNDMTFYALITPGVQMSTNGGYGNFETFGLPATSNTFTVNGAVNNDVYLNLGNSGASNLMLGSNAIGEATVVNNGYTGQYGGLAGSQVNYVSKSGTNSYHGNAIYYWNGRAMNANNWFNNQSGDPKPFSNVNDVGDQRWGAFPEAKRQNILLLRLRRHAHRSADQCAGEDPQPPVRNRYPRQSAATGQAQAASFYQNIFHLYTRRAGRRERTFPCRAAAAARFTLLGAGVPCALQFRSNQGNFTKEYVWSARVDHNFSANDRIFVQVQRDNGTQPTYTDPINPIFNAFSPQPSMNGQISETHTFGSTAVNQFILTGQYYSARFGPPDYNAVLAVFPTVIRFSPALFSEHRRRRLQLATGPQRHSVSVNRRLQ